MKKKLPTQTGIDQPKEHPVTKELAASDMHWVRHVLMQKWVQEYDWTPWCCSVASETYFCS